MLLSTTPPKLSGRQVAIYRSRDFIQWDPAGALSFFREGQHRDFPYGLGEEAHEGISVWDRGNVMLGLYGLWHGAAQWEDRTVDLGFVISNDGIHFREPIREFVFLLPGATNEWDQRALLQAQAFENVGDKTYIWYGSWFPGSSLPRGGVGLATLERDRFGSFAVRDPTRPAILMTSVLKAEGQVRISVNVTGVSSKARLSVELLDRMDRPIPGFSGPQAAKVENSGYRVPVIWPSGKSMQGLEFFRLRVLMEGAGLGGLRLYAIYVGSS